MKSKDKRDEKRVKQGENVLEECDQERNVRTSASTSVRGRGRGQGRGRAKGME